MNSKLSEYSLKDIPKWPINCVSSEPFARKPPQSLEIWSVIVVKDLAWIEVLQK